jgi:hypothetical protein
LRKLSFKIRLSLVALIVLIMFGLHNSFWLWQWDGRLPLLFGFMPFAFSFYVAYAFLATAAMGLVIGLAWPDPPDHLFKQPTGEEAQRR